MTAVPEQNMEKIREKTNLYYENMRREDFFKKEIDKKREFKIPPT